MPGKPYNGFSPAERRVAGDAARRARDAGKLPPLMPCSMCGRRRPNNQLHSEDYRPPHRLYSLCRRCHYAVHIRFTHPAYWSALLTTLGPDGWFHQLRLDPETLTRPFDQSYPTGVLGATLTLTNHPLPREETPCFLPRPTSG